MRALVIPREDSDPELLNDVLAPFCTVDLADSGEDAVSRFTDGFESGSPYGILFFLGIALPGMNGVQTALEIRNLEISRNKYPGIFW